MTTHTEPLIVRVVEEIEADATMHSVMSRAGRLKRARVEEYWAVDAAARRIYVFRLVPGGSEADRKVPPDWERTEAEFFGPASEAPP